MSPLWGPLCPYMHSTLARLLSHIWMRNRGLRLMGSSTRGSWGGRYIQPMINSPSTCDRGERRGMSLCMTKDRDLSHAFHRFKSRCINIPLHWAVHHTGLCQAAKAPRCVCMGAALQNKVKQQKKAKTLLMWYLWISHLFGHSTSSLLRECHT